MGTMSRRYVLAAGAGALAGASAVACGGGLSAVAAPAGQAGPGGTPHEDVIRKWYAAWEKTDWAPVDGMMADEFTFSSAAGDDHLSKAVYKSQCWDSQNGLAEHFELEQVFGSGNEALVKYLCRTKAGKSFRNVEFFRFNADGRIAALECYFGEQGSFPSSVNKKG